MKNLIILKICKNCKTEFLIQNKRRTMVFCCAKCRIDFFAKRSQVKARKQAEENGGWKNNSHCFIPLPTILEMTQTKVKHVLSVIESEKIKHYEREREWHVHETIFNFLRVVKPLEAL